MFWLFLGILLWSVAHLFPSVLPDVRKEFVEKLEEKKYMGIFAGVILLSLLLIVLGWCNSAVDILYNAPALGKSLNMLFMLVAIVLLGASHGTSRLRQYVRHPMLTGMHIWALGHLLANGETRSVLLFGGMLVWSSLSIYFINKRDGAWVKPVEIASMEKEIRLVAISVVVYLLLVLLHPYFTGVSVM